ncbi:MAG: T9SS type A sorting domain-containing protein, partial [Candidatus Marinimicrobia bacterium]|nr:T9SS type A sorting domain-containing protein [Candidatus Neomarinimicrobiota bacterium]
QNPGRLNLYSISNDSTREAVGTYSPVYFTSGSSVQDNEGPIISFETKKGRILKSDDHFRNNETLVIRLEDSLGINLAGEPGHEISLTDLATGDVTDITNGFIYDPNSIQTGTIQPNLDGFSETINIHIKAWNSANKPSEKDIYLNQAENNSLRLFQVMNYPNPFKTSTQFVFEISTPAEVSIDVYTLSGRKIKSFEKKTFQTAGYYTVNWEDGRDSFGGELANGVYLYRVKADANGSSVSTIGRMAKFR